VASSFCYQLHSGHPLRKGVVTIDAPNFINGLGLYCQALPAALGVRQFVEGPAAWFSRLCRFHGVTLFLASLARLLNKDLRNRWLDVVQEDGEVHFLKDIYGHDAALESALASRSMVSNRER